MNTHVKRTLVATAIASLVVVVWMAVMAIIAHFTQPNENDAVVAIFGSLFLAIVAASLLTQYIVAGHDDE